MTTVIVLELVEEFEENLDVSSIYAVATPIGPFEDYGVQDFDIDMGSMDFGEDW